MTEKQLIKLFTEAQEFMGLNNWDIVFKYSKLETDYEGMQQAGRVLQCSYSYLKATIEFNEDILNWEDDTIISTVFHELSHIYTSSTWQIIKEDEKERLEFHLGANYVQGLGSKTTIVGEQQTELLARRFIELYKKSGLKAKTK